MRATGAIERDARMQRLLAANPIAQLPALELDDGSTLINSPLICAYLDGFNGKPKLLPLPTQAAHWRVRHPPALPGSGRAAPPAGSYPVRSAPGG